MLRRVFYWFWRNIRELVYFFWMYWYNARRVYSSIHLRPSVQCGKSSLLLLHDETSDASTFFPVLSVLKLWFPDRNLFAFSQLKKISRTRTVPLLQYYIDCVKSITQNSNVVIVAHGSSGLIALRYFLLHPDVVKGVVTIGTHVQTVQGDLTSHPELHSHLLTTGDSECEFSGNSVFSAHHHTGPSFGHYSVLTNSSMWERIRQWIENNIERE
jgi:pimeloyl-ACP methyl ester carboxylesterase